MYGGGGALGVGAPPLPRPIQVLLKSPCFSIQYSKQCLWYRMKINYKGVIHNDILIVATIATVELISIVTIDDGWEEKKSDQGPPLRDTHIVSSHGMCYNYSRHNIPCTHLFVCMPLPSTYSSGQHKCCSY